MSHSGTPWFATADMRNGVILPLACVAALAVVVVLAMVRPWARDEGAVAAKPTTEAQTVSDNVPAARSAAAMVAQDPMHALLVEQDRVRAERLRYLAALDAAYRAEPIDAAWAGAAERALLGMSQHGALAESGVAPDAWSTQCRSRSCKVAAVFADYDDAQDWANYFLTGTGDVLAQAELSVQQDADNATHVLIFGARR